MSQNNQNTFTVNTSQNTQNLFTVNTSPRIIKPTISLLLEDGTKYILSPKEDLTPLELFNILEWKDIINSSFNLTADICKDLAIEYNILRHFKVEFK